MKTAKPPKPPLSGGARLKKKGRKLIWVHLDDDQHRLLVRAARADNCNSMSRFAILAILDAANRILEKNPGS